MDVQRKDGSRTLLVPNIKDAQALDFRELVEAFDELVTRSRKGDISPDDFMGTTVSLTNPGTVGTTSSAPRLMPGQGLIVATGALDYPAEYRSMAPQTLGLLGISKVMTVSSTYDHRIIQGAESGLFLSRMEELLKGEDGFYERMFEDLGMPHRPVPLGDGHPARPHGVAPPAAGEDVEKQAKVLQLIHAYRVRGHLVADLDPLGPSPGAPPGTWTRPRTASPCGTWIGSSSPAATSASSPRTGPRSGRSWTPSGPRTAAPSGSSTCTSPTRSGRPGSRSDSSRARARPWTP